MTRPNVIQLLQYGRSHPTSQNYSRSYLDGPIALHCSTEYYLKQKLFTTKHRTLGNVCKCQKFHWSDHANCPQETWPAPWGSTKGPFLHWNGTRRGTASSVLESIRYNILSGMSSRHLFLEDYKKTQKVYSNSNKMFWGICFTPTKWQHLSFVPYCCTSVASTSRKTPKCKCPLPYRRQSSGTLTRERLSNSSLSTQVRTTANQTRQPFPTPQCQTAIRTVMAFSF